MTRDTYYEKSLEEPSNSSLNHFRRSALAFYDYVVNGQEETQPFRYGRAFHQAILEPKEFARSFVRIPDGRLTSSTAKEEWAAQCLGTVPDGAGKMSAAELRGVVEKALADHGKTVMTDSEHAMLLGQVATLNLDCHADARRLLKRGDKEREFHWTDSASGVKCKGKVDSWDRERLVGYDLKTTEDADVDAFRRSTLAYGYHFQEAMYRRAIEAVDGIRARYVETPDGYESEVLWCFLLVGKERPYHWSWATLEPRLVWEADQEISRNLADLAVCLKTNNWPGRWTAEPRRIDRWRTAA